VHRRLSDALVAQGGRRLGDGGGTIRTGEELPDDGPLPRQRDAFLAKDCLDIARDGLV
jgi:hypothetical protein